MENEQPEQLCLPKLGETLQEGQEIATEIINVYVGSLEYACQTV
jgi:hypothetical protein